MITREILEGKGNRQSGFILSEGVTEVAHKVSAKAGLSYKQVHGTVKTSTEGGP